MPSAIAAQGVNAASFAMEEIKHTTALPLDYVR